MRAFVIALGLIAAFFGGFFSGKHFAYKEMPAKCPKGQKMIHQNDGIDACFTPGVYYSDIRI